MSLPKVKPCRWFETTRCGLFRSPDAEILKLRNYRFSTLMNGKSTLLSLCNSASLFTFSTDQFSTYVHYEKVMNEDDKFIVNESHDMHLGVQQLILPPFSVTIFPWRFFSPWNNPYQLPEKRGRGRYKIVFSIFTLYSGKSKEKYCELSYYASYFSEMSKTDGALPIHENPTA